MIKTIHSGYVIASRRRSNPGFFSVLFRLRFAMKRFLFLLFIITSQVSTPVYANPSYSNDAYPFTTSEDANRFSALTNEIRCIVCQHQSIAESNSPIAESLRHKIYKMILEKKTNTEINDYLVKRYGEFILLNPRVNSHTMLLWLLPLILLLTGIAFLARYFKSS